MIDLSQVAMALRGATERSLLILDEFGKGMAESSFAGEWQQMPSIADNKGTTSTDGAGLLAAVIEHLQQGHFPRTIVLTHFQCAGL
jgi:DNA mismatch repair protein MSH5